MQVHVIGRHRNGKATLKANQHSHVATCTVLQMFVFEILNVEPFTASAQAVFEAYHATWMQKLQMPRTFSLTERCSCIQRRLTADDQTLFTNRRANDSMLDHT
jgi:hypothetical protein